MTEETQQNRSVLLIHGRDFKPAAATYLELAVSAMRAGLQRDFPACVECFDRLSIDLAWYGDLNAEVLQRKGKVFDEGLDVGDRRNVLKALSEITPRKKFASGCTTSCRVSRHCPSSLWASVRRCSARSASVCL